MSELRKCDLCDNTTRVRYIEKVDKHLCHKHQRNLNKNGYIKRTIYDPNEIRILESYAEFDTYDKSGKVNGAFKVDLDIVNFIKNNKIHKHKDGYACYKTKKYGKDINMRLHRYIMDIHDNYGDKIVDHINQDKSDNRKENLRVVNHLVNNLNMGNLNTNTSGYKGISYCKRDNKWETYIHKNNKKISLGRFFDLKEAIKEREIGEIIYFGKNSLQYNNLVNKYKDDTRVIRVLSAKEEI